MLQAALGHHLCKSFRFGLRWKLVLGTVWGEGLSSVFRRLGRGFVLVKIMISLHTSYRKKLISMNTLFKKKFLWIAYKAVRSYVWEACGSV